MREPAALGGPEGVDREGDLSGRVARPAAPAWVADLSIGLTKKLYGVVE